MRLCIREKFKGWFMRRERLLRTLIWCTPFLLLLVLASSALVDQAVADDQESGIPQASSIEATPIATTGCGKPALISPGTSANEVMLSGGIMRLYRLHIPRGYLPTRKYALVLSFHGHGSNASAQERLTGFSALADQQGFLAAYPQGTVGPDGRTGWATGPRKDPIVDDVGFVDDLLTLLQAKLCVDPERIYATGFSNGGGMTAMLACMMADRFAAFAAVSGSYYPLPGGCDPGRPVSILEIHGTADKTVPYNGSLLLHLPPIPEWLSGWAARDGCASAPTTFFQHGNITGEQWSGCRAGASVVHYRIAGGKHSWPGTFPALNSARPFCTCELLWSFLEAHSLSPGGVSSTL
jgi:polyhydroxybutyrate depolymerase